jgi:hypothetical protein
MKETIVLSVKARLTVMHVSHFSQIPTAKQTKQKVTRNIDTQISTKSLDYRKIAARSA